jgi:hypothetical protein
MNPCLSLLLIIGFGLGSSAFAQYSQTKGATNDLKSETQGTLVPNADLTVKRQQKETTAQSNESGPYRIENLVASIYTVRRNATAPKTNLQPSEEQRDGRHDFDWDIGTWKIHVKRLQHPLTGSTTWVEYNGTDVVRKILGGWANSGDVTWDGATGHVEIFTLRLYNSEAHQWNIYFANSAGSPLGRPAVGEFKNGRGEFYDQEDFNGRAILVRFGVSDITPNSCRFEQAFSADGGKAWEVNLIVTETLVKK